MVIPAKVYCVNLPTELGNLNSQLVRVRTALEKKQYGEAYNAIITAQVIGDWLYKDYPIILQADETYCMV